MATLVLHLGAASVSRTGGIRRGTYRARNRGYPGVANPRDFRIEILGFQHALLILNMALWSWDLKRSGFFRGTTDSAAVSG